MPKFDPMNDVRLPFTLRLKMLMMSRCRVCRDLAEAAGVTVTCFRFWLKGASRPTVQAFIDRLAADLGVQARVLKTAPMPVYDPFVLEHNQETDEWRVLTTDSYGTPVAAKASGIENGVPSFDEAEPEYVEPDSAERGLTLSLRLRMLAASKKMDAEGFADLLGTSVNAAKNVLTGENRILKVQWYGKIAEHFEVPKKAILTKTWFPEAPFELVREDKAQQLKLLPAENRRGIETPWIDWENNGLKGPAAIPDDVPLFYSDTGEPVPDSALFEALGDRIAKVIQPQKTEKSAPESAGLKEKPTVDENDKSPEAVNRRLIAELSDRASSMTTQQLYLLNRMVNAVSRAEAILPTAEKRAFCLRMLRGQDDISPEAEEKAFGAELAWLIAMTNRAVFSHEDAPWATDPELCGEAFDEDAFRLIPFALGRAEMEFGDAAADGLQTMSLLPRSVSFDTAAQVMAHWMAIVCEEDGAKSMDMMVEADAEALLKRLEKTLTERRLADYQTVTSAWVEYCRRLHGGAED